ncbi:MAG TPA: GNAT family N-acetyltransferase [Candidatus Acidoferrum sp.]|jgi:aminoglycoside 6'-N-acetyltransferase I
MDVANDFHVRGAVPSDLAELASLRTALWPESPLADHTRELRAILGGTFQSVMPLVIFVAEENYTVLGFLEAGLRSTADGCDVSRPVGYVEGWYVIESRRGQGIGRALLNAAENWAREQGCREMASDADIHNTLSHRVHQASGFAVTARSILYRKSL